MRKILVYCLMVFIPINLYSQIFNPIAALQDSTTKVFVEKLIETAWKNYPQNRSLQSRIKGTEEGLYQSKWSWLNNLNLSYQYSPQITGTTTTTSTTFPKFGLGVSVNIGNVFLTPSRIAQSEEELNIARDNYEAQKIYIRAEVLRRFANYSRSVEMLKIRSRAVEDSESTLNLVKIKFKNGEVGLEEYDKTLRSYTDNLERRAESQGDILYHKASLEEIICLKLEEVK